MFNSQLRSIALAGVLAFAIITIPLSAETPSNAEKEQGRLIYERAERGDFSAIRQHALNLLEEGAYPDFTPDPRGAVNYLERVLKAYNGENRAQLEANLVSYRRYAAAFESTLASAERGEPAGLFLMAHRYDSEHSIGVREDKQKALSLFQAAADKGHIEAHEVLAKKLYYGNPPDKDKAIFYMQKGEALGLKTAAYWLDQWGAPRSPELARRTANALVTNNTAAASFAPGTFSPNFWGATLIAQVSRRAYTRSELLPLLEQVKAGSGGVPASKTYKAWGLPLGSSPTRLQLLRSAKSFIGCVIDPVTPRTVAGIDLQRTASVGYEEWTSGNRKAVRIGCYAENVGIRVPISNRILYYFVDDRLVAVQATLAIYVQSREFGTSRVICSAPIYAPANLVTPQWIGSGWTFTRRHSLSKTPLSGIRYGDWFTLSRPGAVMHVFPKRWPNLTIEGSSSVAKCGTGTAEYLITTSQFNAALNLNGSALPHLRIGRPASLMEEEN